MGTGEIVSRHHFSALVADQIVEPGEVHTLREAFSDNTTDDTRGARLEFGQRRFDTNPSDADDDGHPPHHLQTIGVIRINHAQAFLSPAGEQEPGYHVGDRKL